MTNPSLEKFVARVQQARRIGFADLRRLQRDVLPAGISRREEAEALIALDRHLAKADDGWLPFLASAIRTLVVTPSCRVDPEAARWLADALAGAPARTSVVIAREVIRDVNEVDAGLLALAKQRPRARAIPQAASEPLAPEHLPA